MNLIKEISREIKRIINCDIDIERFIETPSDFNKSEYVFKSFKVSKLLNISPEIIAQKIKKSIKLDFVDHIEIINSYVNFYINKSKYVEYSLREISNKSNAHYKTNTINNKYIHKYTNNELHKYIRQLGSIALYNFISNICTISGYNSIYLNMTDFNYKLDKSMQGYAKRIICYLQENKLIYNENNCLCVNLNQYNNSPFLIMKNNEFTKEAIILFKVIYFIENRKDVVCICIYDACEHNIFKKIDAIIKIINSEFINKYLFICNYTIKVIKNSIIDINSINFYILSHKKNDKIIFDYVFNTNSINKYYEIRSCLSNAYDFIKSYENCNLKVNNKVNIYNEVRILNNYNNVLNKVINELDSSLLCKYIIEVSYSLNAIIKTKRVDVDNNIVLLVKASLNVIKNGLLFLGIDVS